ncbi:MAG: inositol monophosphatase family protein [Chitinophagales bacterium]
MTTIDLISVQNKVMDIVKDVAAFIQSEIGTINNNDIETKSLNSLVTYVDKESEKKLVADLQQLIPSATFLTEENTIEQAAGEWQWIIDPLDGTTNFIHSIPVFGISVALKHNDEIVVGVVYEVNKNECFHAVKDNGAFVNGNKIAVTQTAQLADTLIATGFPYYDFDRTENYLNTFRTLIKSTRGVRRLGAASIDLCYVACGRFDAFFEYSLAPWDVAAGALIVKEAGGKVTDFSGNNNWLFGKEIIACNTEIADEFLDVINENF